MFGPNSAGTQADDRWTGLRFVYDSLSVTNDNPNYTWILAWFQSRGCVLIEMPAETHDKQAAQTQFLTHFLARSLPLVETQVDTMSYTKLKRAIAMVSADSDDLFEAMYRTNTTHCNALLDSLEENIRVKRKKLNSLGSL
jgi:prephenate dehydrogenase